MISRYGRPQTTLIGWIGVIGIVAAAIAGWWSAAGVVLVVMVALLAFFRDPERRIPTRRGGVVAPADGRISSVHQVEHFEPFGGPATCIRIFLSVLDVHVNRAPMYGQVHAIRHKPGEYLNALKAESAERNESVTLTLHHPTHGHPVGAVRQVAGAIARRIVCGAEEGEILQRGQRFGLIKFGSTTEVYLPRPDEVRVEVREGQYVYGGATLVAVVGSTNPGGESESAGGGSAEAPPDSGPHVASASPSSSASAPSHE